MRRESRVELAPKWVETLYWANVRRKYQAGNESIQIATLVSPLRYDILVRVEFFRLIMDEHEDSIDLGGVANDARVRPYFEWFSSVACPQFMPHLVTDEAALGVAFRQQIRRAVRLKDSFMQRGYDRKRPILLKTGSVVESTATGKLVQHRYFPGNGCHRLALLLLGGSEELQPGQYRVGVQDCLRPRDNTAILLPSLAMTASAYYSFVSRGYLKQECLDEPSLRETLRRERPERYEEVDSVIEYDKRWVSA